MKILTTISEDEMIATFLKAEIASIRFSSKIFEILRQDKKSEDIIRNPDLNNISDNEYRKKVLTNHRGYAVGDSVFEDFPSDVIWKKVLLTKSDLQNAKYINYDYWVELSNGTRLAKDGAENVAKGKEVFKQPNDNFLEAAEAVKNGTVFEKLIFVTADEGKSLVVLEGHLRLTAYCIAITHIPEELEAIVGFSKDIEKWSLY